LFDADLDLELVTTTVDDLYFKKDLAHERVVVPLPHVQAIELVFVLFVILISSIDYVGCLKFSHLARLRLLPIHVAALLRSKIHMVTELFLGEGQIVKSSGVTIHVFARQRVHLDGHLVDVFFIDFLSHVVEGLADDVLRWVVV
jgi:hypothetical protein